MINVSMVTVFLINAFANPDTVECSVIVVVPLLAATPAI